MGLLLPKYVSTGLPAAVRGLLSYEFVTAVVFTCTNLGHHQPAGYGIVEMEDVSVGTEIIYKSVHGSHLLLYI